MAGKKYTRVRAHIRRTPAKKAKSKDNDMSPIERIVQAETENIIKGRQRKIS